jgi:hypothetical protein
MEPTLPLGLEAGWDSRAYMDAVEMSIISYLCWEFNLDPSAVQPIACCYTD